MTLIIDCGSTKAEWALLDGKNVVLRFVSNGFNPNFCDEKMISEIIENSLQNIDNQNVKRVVFYGSGCGSKANQDKIKAIFKKALNKAEIEVYPDTLGACHALFGKKAGIACILGTGSNACVFDGEKITESVASLGFMIGDEGSGCHIGKRIVHDYFLGLMPADLRAKFDEKYHLDRDKFLKKVYHGEQPSRFLAEFAKFASENIENQYIRDVVGGCFEEFIKYSLMVSANDNVAFVGSVAFAFQSVLLQQLGNHNIKCEKVLKNPMDGLVEFYKN
ncbi:MAG: hypothetical protein IKS65_06460 [Bacteroidales bacterium]|nr:hypothetical protein [Bacteroidales bacterium]